MSFFDGKLKPTQAAEYVGLKPPTLAKMRVRGDGPKYVKVGRKVVIYEISDLDEWIARQKRSSTSEAGSFPYGKAG